MDAAGLACGGTGDVPATFQTLAANESSTMYPSSPSSFYSSITGGCRPGRLESLALQGLIGSVVPAVAGPAPSAASGATQAGTF